MLIYPKVKIQYPMSLEREYARELVKYVRKVRDICIKRIPFMVEAVASNAIRKDEWTEETTDEVESDIEEEIAIAAVILAMYNRIRIWNTRQQEKIFQSMFGGKPTRGQMTPATLRKIGEFIGQTPDFYDKEGKIIPEKLKLFQQKYSEIVKALPNVISQADYDKIREIWVNRNMELIRSIDRRTMESIRYTLGENIIKAVDNKTVAAELKDTIVKMAEVNEKRAALIACDQVGKLNSQLVQLEQMSQGVEKYKWQTMEDNRVRPQHQSYNQKDFSWSEPPDGGHPGWAIRCRCVAIPLYDTDKIGLQPKAGTFKIVR